MNFITGQAEGWTIRPRTRPGLVRGYENIFSRLQYFLKKENPSSNEENGLVRHWSNHTYTAILMKAERFATQSC